MENVLLTIEKKIWESIDNEERIGLFNGLSGVALFYDYLFLHDNREEYKEKLIILLDKINTIIAEELSSVSLNSGLAGFGLTLLKLKNDFVSIDDSYFTDIDAILKEELEEEANNSNYDYLNGSLGIAMYFLERYKKDKNIGTTAILNNYIGKFISKINTDLLLILRKPTLNEGHCYYFGMAHGVASFINFLLYAKLHFTDLSHQIDEPLKNCIAFLHFHKYKNDNSKQLYPNVFLIEENKFINPLLSWCQGDLGIANALYNAGVFLNEDRIIKEAQELIENTCTISLEESGIADYSFCHGTIGILIQYHLASIKFKNDYSEVSEKWKEILVKQTNNFLTFENFEQKEKTQETNLLYGLTGLGLGLLSIDKKINTDWLEIVNLH
ncbi:lanthionine synthetase LanC family protein [Flavobacterium sp. GCM10023249]|uniref:lanthionine synthetase LanC family protein n=1 Tax=unclassified Flavobacterium TaxID=196869 RepID=UPI003623C96E